jgi:Haloacid dehalogenase-like hydrolase
LDTFAAEQRLEYGFLHQGMTLEELFDADISGRDFPRGKPDPMIFLAAAEELGLAPEMCFVIEDATSGVQAAKAGGIAAIGVARIGDEQQLATVGADLVVPTLDDVSLPALLEGRLEERQAVDEIRRRYAERPPNAWTLVYDGFDPDAKACAKRSARWATAISLRGARCRRLRPTKSIIPGPMWPAFTTG